MSNATCDAQVAIKRGKYCDGIIVISVVSFPLSLKNNSCASGFLALKDTENIFYFSRIMLLR
jgi:hypothetical protein